MRLRGLATLAVAAAAVALAGCGISNPYAQTRTARSTPAPPAAVARLSRVDQRRATRVATAYGLASANWSASTFHVAYRTMVALSAGSLQANLQANPPDQDIVRSLVLQREEHRATLVAAAMTGSGRATATVIVVLREQASAAAIATAAPTYNVYRAGLSLHGGAWRVTRWEALP